MKTLRRYEGEAVLRYFSQFNQLILRHKEDFSIDVRNRRPPLDRVNALFSFTYVLLIGMCAAALETVVGALCRIYAYRQAGQAFFGVDPLEGPRVPYAERFVLSYINKKIVHSVDFEQKGNGAVTLNESGRKSIIGALYANVIAGLIC